MARMVVMRIRKASKRKIQQKKTSLLSLVFIGTGSLFVFCWCAAVWRLTERLDAESTALHPEGAAQQRQLPIEPGMWTMKGPNVLVYNKTLEIPTHVESSTTKSAVEASEKQQVVRNRPVSEPIKNDSPPKRVGFHSTNFTHLKSNTTKTAAKSSVKQQVVQNKTVSEPVKHESSPIHLKSNTTKTAVESSVKQQVIQNKTVSEPIQNLPPKYVDIHCTNCTRYIVFKPIGQGQGAGQDMNGLLAAHLLGDEFDRIVCVSPTFTSFHNTFQPIMPQAIQDCPTLHLNPKPSLTRLVNFQRAPDECALKDELLSDKQIVYIVGNTYPRWRQVPDNYFTRFYKPKSSLQSMLPWSEPPSTVVHLRKGDSTKDARAGLDSKTLVALGEALPSDTYLVANDVNWFDFFAEKYGWKHPEWHAVRHSARRSFVKSWGTRGELTEKDNSTELQSLQMWSDWYTILSAKKVWHTHSDFSLSAIHWMGIESKTITGANATGHLELLDEPWRRDPPCLPLMDRTKEDLGSCKNHAAPAVRASAKQQVAQNKTLSEPIKNSPPKYVDIHCTNCTRYIVFKPIGEGQGTGQDMNGLLAAHLLGDEFDRIVCVSPTFTSFHNTFQPIMPQAIQDCPTLPVHINPKPKFTSLINYHAAPDECALKDELMSDKQIVYIVANTYPRWRDVPGNYFVRFYKPKSSLQSMLPWSEPPSTVVHLRKGDSTKDARAGLDNKTLVALGKALPSDTYLVANDVNWFDFFAEKYGWSHPEWHAVRHSARRSFVKSWGSRGELTEKDNSTELQSLQMWSDWYTILSAKKVWHTHSDFSLSAIHWMGIESKTITGANATGHLELLDEPWRRDPSCLPLKDRIREDLGSCKK